MVHAAAGMPPVLVAQIQLVVLGYKTQAQHPCLQVAVPHGRSSLATVCLELVDQHAQRCAGLAAIAVRPVGKHAAAPKPLGDQLRIDVALNEMAGRGDLRPGLPVRQVAAGVRSCRIELQSVQRKVIELRHAVVGVDGSSSFQYTGSNAQRGAGCWRALSTSVRNCVRDISRPPSEARCCVFCWQSII